MTATPASEARATDASAWARCGNCGESWFAGTAQLPEPWCATCRKENAAGYRVAYRANVLLQARAHLAAAGVPEAFRGCTLESYSKQTAPQRAALTAVQAWAVESRKPRRGRELGLYLYGPPGVGKTHLGVAVLLDRIAEQRRGRFVSVASLLLQCRESFFGGEGRRQVSEILEQECFRCETLLLDDLGASKSSSEFSRDVLLRVVDHAYAHCRPQLIVSSNLKIDALAKLDGRICDRLRELCLAVYVGGESYRRRAAGTRLEV